MVIPHPTLKSLFVDWYDDLLPILTSDYFIRLFGFLNKEYKKYRHVVYPTTKKDIFNVFKKTKYKDVRVVILGDEPDESSGDYAYSIADESITISHSAIRLRDCLERRFSSGLLLNFDHTLEEWAKQGVLLLNTALTSENGNPEAHFIYWAKFTEYVVKMLNDNKTGLIFVLWGNRAKQYKHLINNKKHYILEGEGIRYAESNNIDWDTTHFEDINEIISDNNGEEYKINWVQHCK